MKYMLLLFNAEGDPNQQPDPAEMERVSEGQRFLTKLLAERSDSTAKTSRAPDPGNGLDS